MPSNHSRPKGFTKGANMTAKRSFRLGLAAILGFIPLAIKMPYIVQAWRTSPLDRPGWVFGLLFLTAAAAAAPVVRERMQGWDRRALLALLPAAAAILAGMTRDIHALSIIGAIGFAWAVLWLAAGWRSAYCLVPAFALLMLMSTSLRYWLGYFSGPLLIDGLVIMVVIAVAAIAWLIVNLLRKAAPSCESFCFTGTGLAVLAAIGAFHLANIHAKAPAFIPDFTSMAFGDFLGRELPVTDSDRQFFGDNQIGKYFFASDASTIVVLAVNCGDDVHQVHPASHCLRTSGWTILSENSQPVRLETRTLYVHEIVAARDNLHIMVWAWYSSNQLSTGSFLNFRHLWKPTDAWASFQLQTSLEDNQELARLYLTDFLNDVARTNGANSVAPAQTNQETTDDASKNDAPASAPAPEWPAAEWPMP